MWTVYSKLSSAGALQAVDPLILRTNSKGGHHPKGTELHAVRGDRDETQTGTMGSQQLVR
jgi:hypothetical protein